MFDSLIAGFKQRKALREWEASPVGSALRSHTQQYFSGSYVRLTQLPQDNKERIINEFYAKVFALPNTENPHLAIRQHIAEYMLAYAELSLLALTPEDKASQHYADCPYISGELYRHIDRTSEVNGELKKLKWQHADNPLSGEELISYCNTRGIVLAYYLNGFNLVRYLNKDFDKPKDWFKPFLTSSMIYFEDHYRDKIGMPRLLPTSLHGLMHSTFANFVAKGFDNPYYEWEKAYAEFERGDQLSGSS